MRVLMLFIGLASFLHVRCQDEYRINWLNNDLTPYDTYSVAEFIVNGQVLDYAQYDGLTRFTDAFNKNMSKKGLKASDQSVLHVFFDIKLDTLPVGYQRPDGARPEDRIFDLNLTMKDVEVDELLVDARLQSRSKDPKRFDKEMRKMLNAFFREAQFAE